MSKLLPRVLRTEEYTVEGTKIQNNRDKIFRLYLYFCCHLISFYVQLMFQYIQSTNIDSAQCMNRT